MSLAILRESTKCGKMPSVNKGKGKPWRARICKNGKDFYLGTFNTRDEAAEAEQLARKKYPPRNGLNHYWRDRRPDGTFI